MNISLIMRLSCLKTAIHVPETRLEGSVSQDFDKGLSLNLKACRNGDKLQKITKVTRFMLLNVI